MTLTRVTYSMILGEVVNVKDFGAVGDGAADDTAAIQAAIDYCKSQNTANTGTFGGGYMTLRIPAGFYKVTSTLNFTGFNGFEMVGDGPQATTIVFTATGSTLMNWTTYLKCAVRNMSLFAGSISFSNGKPTFTGEVVQSNVCANFNSTSSGAYFTWDNVNFSYWETVFRSKDSIINGDNHKHRNCFFLVNKKVWDNTNTQAVVWAFTDCLAYDNTNMFINPGGSLVVRGGDMINPGDFLTLGLLDTSFSILIDGVNFENYQNQDPTSTPRFVVVTGGSGSEFTFRNCTARGGGTLAGKTSGTFVGLWRGKLENCYLTGNWDVTVSSSSEGITSTLIIEDCVSAPTVVQTVVAGQGNCPMNLIYRDQTITTASQNRVNRSFAGALSTQDKALTGTEFTDYYRFEGLLNAITGSKSCPIFVVSPYIVQLVGVQIEWTNNTTNTVVIDVWESSAKITKLATVTTAAASGQYQNLEIDVAGILARYQINSASSPLFIEFTASGNAGFCKANIGLKFRQVS